MVDKYDLSDALSESLDILSSRRFQNALKNAGKGSPVKRILSRVADPVTKQAMGVDSSGLVSELPKPMIKWFVNLAGGGGRPRQRNQQYRVIEVPVEEFSEEY